MIPNGIICKKIIYNALFVCENCLMFKYEWTLKEANSTKDKGKVFSCFSCGGGSTMGYKLAGFDVVGCNEIDPKMMDVYKANHNPKYSYLESIVDFAARDDFPDDLYDLDILDGSPPCSSFSMAGNREKDWGKEKKFREGQKEQVLDRLFFDFIALAKKLKPKVVVAENVKGLLLGDAQKYVNDILLAFDDAGYAVDYQLLNASKMGVPQRRERVFFYAIRRDLAYKTTDLFGGRPRLDLEFDEEPVIFGDFRKERGTGNVDLSAKLKEYWLLCKPGDSFSTVHPKGSYFNEIKVSLSDVLPTIRADKPPFDAVVPRKLFNEEIVLAGTFPADYNFKSIKPNYLIGMSVPPVMMAHIATQVYEQWLVHNQ